MKLIDLAVYKGDEDIKDENLKSWEIVSVNPTLIEIDLTFYKPLYVSQGYESDRLIVEISLTQFTDENQARLHPGINRIKRIP